MPLKLICRKDFRPDDGLPTRGDVFNEFDENYNIFRRPLAFLGHYGRPGVGPAGAGFAMFTRDKTRQPRPRGRRGMIDGGRPTRGTDDGGRGTGDG